MSNFRITHKSHLKQNFYSSLFFFRSSRWIKNVMAKATRGNLMFPVWVCVCGEWKKDRRKGILVIQRVLWSQSSLMKILLDFISSYCCCRSAVSQYLVFILPRFHVHIQHFFLSFFRLIQLWLSIETSGHFNTKQSI